MIKRKDSISIFKTITVVIYAIIGTYKCGKNMEKCMRMIYNSIYSMIDQKERRATTNISKNKYR